MTTRWPGRFASFVCLPIIAVLVAVPGCRKQDPGFEVITLEGTIEKIKLTADDAGEITLTYYSEKHGQEMEGIGLVTPETEIMINGAVAKLKDLREGERVRGEVRIEKENDKKRQIALKIYIDRPKPVGGEGG
jgi:transcription termination factor Rho